MRTTNDPVALALASLVTGAATGGTVITLGVIVLRFLPGQETIQEIPDHLTTQDVILQVSLVGGVLVAATSGWLLTRAILDYYHRGLTAALGVFGSFVLGGMAVPVDMIGHRIGLFIYVTALVALGNYSFRKARRAAAS